MRLEGTAPRGALGGVTGGVTLQKRSRMVADVDGRRLFETPEKQGIRSHRRMTADLIVELGRIELPSARRSLDLLRPFPRLWLYGCHVAGSIGPEPTAESFLEVSVLSHRQRSLPAVHHYFCCRAVVVWPRALLRVTMSLYYLMVRSGGESEVAVGASFGCPV